MPSHQEIDARSLALHRLIAQKVARQPALLEKELHTVKRWQTLVSTSSQPYLREWEELLDQGADACLAVAAEESQRAAALRQCSPFTNILSNAERFAFLKNWKSNEAQRA